MNLNKLPYETIFQIMLDEPTNTIINYCKTSRRASIICEDEYFWEQKAIKYLRIDFRYYKPHLSLAHRYANAEKASLSELLKEIVPNIIYDIFSRLIDENTGTPSIYFRIPEKSNIPLFPEEEDFLEDSKDFRVGVIANNHRIANILLYLVENYEYLNKNVYDLIMDIKEFLKHKKDFIVSPHSIINAIFLSKNKIVSFKLDGIFVGKTNDNVIKNTIENTNIWTIVRLEQLFNEIIYDFIDSEKIYYED